MPIDPTSNHVETGAAAPVADSHAQRPHPELVRTPLARTVSGDSALRAQRYAVLALLALGLGLRVFLLPVAVHPDLLSVYDRVRLWFDGQFTLGDFSFQALPLMLHGLWAKLTGAALPDFGGVPWPTPTEEQVFVQAHDVLAVRGQPASLALWKLPYALADLAAGLLLARLVPARHALGILALWMVHPVALYISGIFAKYEAWMLVPLFGGFLLLKRGRTASAFVAIGVACAMRLYPFALVPAMVLAAGRTPRRRFELLALSALPTLVVLAAAALEGRAESSGTGAWAAWLACPLAAWFGCALYRRLAGRRAELLLWIAVASGVLLLAPRVGAALGNTDYPLSNLLHHTEFLYANLFNAGRRDTLLLFLLAWGGVLAWAQGRPAARRASDDAARFEDTLDAGLLSALAFFSLSFFHPQYAALLIGLVLARLHRMRDGALAHGLQVVGLLLFLLVFRDGNTTTRLFMPLAPDSVLELPGITGLLPLELAVVPWPGVGRTLLFLAAVWMAIDLLRARRELSRSPGAALAPAPTPPLRSAFWIACALTWPAAAGLYLALLPGETLFARVGEPWQEDSPWSPGREHNRLRFLPPMRDTQGADWVELVPGRPAAHERGPSAEVTYGQATTPGGEPVETARDTLPRSALVPRDGRLLLPLGELEPQGWRWHLLSVALQRVETPATPTRLQLYRELSGAELLAEARQEWRERFLGAPPQTDAGDAQPAQAGRAGLPLATWWLGVPLLAWLAAGWLGLRSRRLTRAE